MSGLLLPNAKQQFLDANGSPLAGGKVYYYIPSTTTAKNTYQDINLTVLNTNPIVLDSAGECIAYGSGAYRQQVYDVNGNLIWDQVTYGNLPIDSSTVIYTPPFTNSVTTNVQAKLAQTVSVKDFGAKGDGSTDDTIAIQNAINYVSSIGGGSVYMPMGTYVISSTIYLSQTLNVNFYNPIQLIGAGRASGNISNIVGGTTIKHTGSGIAIWVGDHLNDSTAVPYNSYYFSVKDIALVLNANTTIGYRFRQCYQLRLDNLTVNGTNGSACIGMLFEACVEGLYNLIDIQFGGTLQSGSSALPLCLQVAAATNLARTSSPQGLSSTSSTFLNGYFHYAYQGAIVYGNSITFQNAKWETLVNGVLENSSGFTNQYIANYWENIPNYGIYVYSTDPQNTAGNIDIYGGFAHRYSQDGSDMSGYTATNAFLQLYNAKNVKMTGVQIFEDNSLYSSLAVESIPGGAGDNPQNIYIDADPGTIGNFVQRYTPAGATGITGATVFTVNGSPSVLVTKSNHGLIKGQVIDLVGFNSSALGLTVNRPYCVVSSVSDASNFYITYPVNASATAGSNTGTIKYYTSGKLTMAGLPNCVIFNDCIYETYVFQAIQASAGTNVVMTFNGSPTLYIPYDHYLTSWKITVNNPNTNSVSTYAYINSLDTVANRYDTVNALVGADISGIGLYYNSGLTSIKRQAGQGYSVTLFDNGGSGATYPRTFNVELTIANTLKAPT